MLTGILPLMEVTRTPRTRRKRRIRTTARRLMASLPLLRKAPLPKMPKIVKVAAEALLRNLLKSRLLPVNSPQVRVPCDLLDEYLSVIIEHRLDIELYLSGSVLDSMRPGDAERILQKLTHSPRITVHAPFMDLNPGAVDSRVLEVTRARFHQAFDVAEVLKPEIIVLHSGYEKWKYDHDVDLWLQSSLSFWPEFIQRAESIGARLAIENIFEDEPGSLALLMKALDNSRVGICFDPGHCNIFTTVPQKQWLDVLGPYIIETHLHDNNGDFDSHFALGQGNIDFKEVIAALSVRAERAGQDVIHTIEALSPEDTFKSIKALEAIHQRLSS